MDHKETEMKNTKDGKENKTLKEVDVAGTKHMSRKGCLGKEEGLF